MHVICHCCEQIPHVNVMSKLDLLNKEAKEKLERYLEPDMAAVLSDEMADDEQLLTRFQQLNQALATLVGFMRTVERFVDVMYVQMANYISVNVDHLVCAFYNVLE